jgi:hypothetical protein
MPVQGYQRDDRVRARVIAEEHFVAELTNDADVIVSTNMKSYDPLVTSVVIGLDPQSFHIEHCATVEEQRAFYADSRVEVHMVDVELFTSIGSDWYGFVHGLATHEVLSTKERVTSEVISLLPTTPDEDTVAGELSLGWPGPPAKLGDPPGEIALERAASLRVHNALLDAFRAGDAQLIGDLHTERTLFVMQHPLTDEIASVTGRDAIVAYYQSIFAHATVTSADVVLRVVDRWYVFSELVLQLDSPTEGSLVARLAEICVIGSDDKILVYLATSPRPAIASTG